MDNEPPVVGAEIFVLPRVVLPFSTELNLDLAVAIRFENHGEYLLSRPETSGFKDGGRREIDAKGLVVVSDDGRGDAADVRSIEESVAGCQEERTRDKVLSKEGDAHFMNRIREGKEWKERKEIDRQWELERRN